MSQEKVNKHKEIKLTRKEQQRIARRNSLIRKSVAIVIGVVLVVWIGISAVNMFIDSRPRQTITVDYTAVENYMQTMVDTNAVE